MPQPISWSELYRCRRESARQFGDIFQLPLARRASNVMLEELAAGWQVLEVGAGDRRMKNRIERQAPGIRYQSLDIDPNGQHDYHRLEDVRRSFDCVFAFEVIEHLALDEIRSWLPQLVDLLNPGGRLVLSTPNTFYPPAFLRDVTHRTPLCYDELAGLVTAAGATVERIVRTYHEPVHRALWRRYLLGWLFRTLRIDFAHQIVLVARRPAVLPKELAERTAA